MSLILPLAESSSTVRISWLSLKGCFWVIVGRVGRFILHLKAFFFFFFKGWCTLPTIRNGHYVACRAAVCLAFSHWSYSLPAAHSYWLYKSWGLPFPGQEECSPSCHVGATGKVFCEVSSERWNVVPPLPLPCCWCELSEIPGALTGEMRLKKNQLAERVVVTKEQEGLCKKGTSLSKPCFISMVFCRLIRTIVCLLEIVLPSQM